MLATLAGTRTDALRQQFAVPNNGRLWSELCELGAAVTSLPAARASRPWSLVKARRAFAAHLADLAPDAAVFHGSWTHAMFATVARAQGVLVVFWQHAPIENPRWPDRAAAWTTPDVVIANSLFTAKAPAFPALRCHVIHCPVPSAPGLAAAERRALRASLGATESDVVVLMAGRLEGLKGHTVLLDAAKLLRRGNVKIWVAGGVQRAEERDYLERLESQIAAGGLADRVTLLGQRGDVAGLMCLADVYCQPNVAPESFGIAIAEAMRARLPCIVSNIGGAAELVDAECGILTAPGDAAAVAGAISRLAGDRHEREIKGCAAARRAATLTDPAAKVAELAAVLSSQISHAR
jgi:glycosyltransferase involved in cell wall biosynthesis